MEAGLCPNSAGTHSLLDVRDGTKENTGLDYVTSQLYVFQKRVPFFLNFEAFK